MVTSIRPAATISKSGWFEKFMVEAPADVRETCVKRKHRVSIEKGMRLVRVFNWDINVDPATLEIVRSLGCECKVFGKVQMWTEVDCSALLLPCPGEYEIRMPDDSLLPKETVLEDVSITADVAKCIPNLQVYV